MKKLAILIFTFAFANAGNLDFTSLKSDFTQIVTSDEAKITYNGNFLARDDNKAVWSYKTPTKKVIYFGDDKVIIIEPNIEQAIITNLDNTPNLTAILRTAKQISPEIYVAKFDGVTYTTKFEKNLPSHISYTDKFGNNIEILLNNVVKNSKIDDIVFDVKIPKNFDIITQ